MCTRTPSQIESEIREITKDAMIRVVDILSDKYNFDPDEAKGIVNRAWSRVEALSDEDLVRLVESDRKNGILPALTPRMSNE